MYNFCQMEHWAKIGRNCHFCQKWNELKWLMSNFWCCQCSISNAYKSSQLMSPTTINNRDETLYDVFYTMYWLSCFCQKWNELKWLMSNFWCCHHSPPTLLFILLIPWRSLTKQYREHERPEDFNCIPRRGNYNYPRNGWVKHTPMIQVNHHDQSALHCSKWECT